MTRNSQTLLVARDSLRAREQVLDRTELQTVFLGWLRAELRLGTYRWFRVCL